MKMPSGSRALTLGLVVGFGSLLLPGSGRAQSNQTYDGGIGQWDAGVTKDWDNPADAWTNGNNAYFTAGTNTLMVSGTVETNYMEFMEE
jgi:hypothetical protein